ADVDALAAAVAFAPREFHPAERVRWEIGTKEEREAAVAKYNAARPSMYQLYVLGQAAIRDADFEKALDLFRRATNLLPNYPLPWVGVVEGCSARLAEIPRDDPRRAALLTEAFGAVARAVQLGEPPDGIRNEPAFAPLHDDPRFEKALQVPK
ncbi:MAG: hypothetical protein K8T20_20815, partial [Planctomycetes bacterium]|nr:hypothetical protein [Planctomycetota bacterium]